MDDPFLRALDAVVADARAAEAARERSQERVLRDVAAAESTFVGVLVDLAERGVPVVVRTASSGGRAFRGRVLAVGRDFAVVRDGARPPVLVALAGVASVRPEPDGLAASSAAAGRPAPLDVSLAALLARFGDDRPRVQVVAGDEPVAGQLRSVGLDVLTLRLDGDRGLVAHVHLATVREIVLLDL